MAAGHTDSTSRPLGLSRTSSFLTLGFALAKALNIFELSRFSELGLSLVPPLLLPPLEGREDAADDA